MLNSAQAQFRWKLVFGLVLFCASFLLFAWNNDFLIGLHSDEVRKADLIRYGLNEYKHPLYMRQVIKPFLVLLDVDRTNPQAIVEMGRMSAAVHGAFAVLFFYLSALLFIRPFLAFLFSALLASSSITAIHAHYFKEDIFLLCFLVLSVYLCLRLFRDQDFRLWRWALLGLSLGLTMSSHYKGVVFAGLILLALWITKRNFKWPFITGIIAIICLLIVNAPLFTELQSFKNDFIFEYDHLLEGHAFPIRIDQTFGLFHLSKSFVEGTFSFIPVILLFVLFSVPKILKSRYKKEAFLLLSLFLVYFLIIEISPLKPHPDYGRYAMPLIPLAFLLFAIAVKVDTQVRKDYPRMHELVMMALVGISLFQTIKYEKELVADTRMEVASEDWAARSKECYYEIYSLPHLDWCIRTPLYRANIDSLIDEGYKTAMISSFWFDRFLYGASLRNPEPKAVQLAEFYEDGLKYELRSFLPKYESYAFSNPRVYEVDLVKWNYYVKVKR